MQDLREAPEHLRSARKRQSRARFKTKKRDMKKKYLKPGTTAVSAMTQQLMNDSVGEGIKKEQSEDTSSNTEPNRSRDIFGGDWDEE